MPLQPEALGAEGTAREAATGYGARGAEWRERPNTIGAGDKRAAATAGAAGGSRTTLPPLQCQSVGGGRGGCRQAPKPRGGLILCPSFPPSLGVAERNMQGQETKVNASVNIPTQASSAWTPAAGGDGSWGTWAPRPREGQEKTVKGQGKDMAEAWGRVEGGQEQSCWGESARGAWWSLLGAGGGRAEALCLSRDRLRIE